LLCWWCGRPIGNVLAVSILCGMYVPHSTAGLTRTLQRRPHLQLWPPYSRLPEPFLWAPRADFGTEVNDLSSCWPGCAFAAAGAIGFYRRWRPCGPARPRATACSRRALDDDLADSLRERTLESLDFDYVVQRLREQCCTEPALALSEDPAALLASSPEEARVRYAEVLELAELEDADLVLSEPLDVLQELEACASGEVLEPPRLRAVAAAAEALLKLRNGLERAAGRGAPIPRLLAHVARIELPDDLLDCVLEAFDSNGDLSEQKFPELADLRQRIRELEERCATEMRQVLSSGRYMQYLADDGYMQIGGHYVLSVKPQHARKVGQVMDESRSGRTSYVEPHELIGPAGELTELQRELKFLTRRILGRMCVAVSRANAEFKACLQAAGEIDLARARLFLGEDMEGEVPEVGDEGVIVARHARNPCLLLRGGTRVVGNRLELGSWSQGIILSGPNAGGKTVVLKTLGLLALLVRCGIPVPAGESPRIDFFDVVLAEIGDMQTIVDDLSTYSAHLVASRILLQQAAQAGTRALVMVDEAGTGTDPQQGAALARAVLEALLGTGARVVATTHCMQLKNWALQDPRTEIVAMEYKKGRPTFKLVRNTVGESHAIETARRLELPPALVQRAEALLSEDQRSLLALQRRAEDLEKRLQLQLRRAEEREAQALTAEHASAELERQLAARGEELRNAEAELLARQERLQSQLRAEHRARMDVQARQLRELVRNLRQHVDSGGAAGLRLVGEEIEELRFERDEAARAAAQRAKLVPGALDTADALNPGEWVMVLAKTPWYGFKGRVQQVLGGVGGMPVRVKIQIERSGNTLEFEKTQLGKTSAPPTKGPIKQPKKRQAVDYTKVMSNW